MNLGRERFKGEGRGVGGGGGGGGGGVGVTSWRIASFALARNSVRSEYKVRNSQTIVRNKT